MSLTFIKQNTPPIARIDIPANKQLHNKLVYVNEDMDVTDNVEEMNLDQGQFIPLPQIKDNQRESLFISAPSGSGKSVFVSKYIQEMQKKDTHRKKSVFLFSASVDPDPAFAKIKNLKTIDIYKPELYSLTVQDLKDSIVLFDDWDSTDKEIVDFLCKLLKAILERGRKLKIDCLVIVHDGKQYKLTKPLIYEAQSFVLFPRSGIAACNSFLKTYMSFGKAECDMIKGLRTRSILIHKAAPQYIISSKKIILL